MEQIRMINQGRHRWSLLAMTCVVVLWAARPGMGLVVIEVMYHPADFRLSYFLSVIINEFCKIEVRHTLKRKKSFFVFFFSNNRLLYNKQLGDYLRKSKNRKTDFLQ